MAAPRPQPTAIRVSRGNPSGRPLNLNEPKPEIAVPSVPEFLSLEARAEWDRIVPLLAELGLMSRIDRAGITQYCQAYGYWERAEKELAESFANGEGFTIKTPTGQVKVNPKVTVAREASRDLLRVLVEFGMTPSSRSKVTAGKKTTEKSAWDDI